MGVFADREQQDLLAGILDFAYHSVRHSASDEKRQGSECRKDMPHRKCSVYSDASAAGRGIFSAGRPDVTIFGGQVYDARFSVCHFDGDTVLILDFEAFKAAADRRIVWRGGFVGMLSGGSGAAFWLKPI